jgi:hypothetical protein
LGVSEVVRRASDKKAAAVFMIHLSKLKFRTFQYMQSSEKQPVVDCFSSGQTLHASPPLPPAVINGFFCHGISSYALSFSLRRCPTCCPIPSEQSLNQIFNGESVIATRSASWYR